MGSYCGGFRQQIGIATSLQRLQTFPTGRHAGSKENGHGGDVEVELPAERGDSSGASTSSDGDDIPGACIQRFVCQHRGSLASPRVAAIECVREQPQSMLVTSL